MNILFKKLFISLVKAVEYRAINIKYAINFVVFKNRNDDFGVAGRVASDVTREFMDVCNELSLFFFHSCSANSFAICNSDTGWQTLKRTKYELVIFPYVKANPVNILQKLIE